jgi:site-specific recombinase XerD
MAGGRTVSALAAALCDYLAMRRALGYKLEGQDKVLGQFVAHLESHQLDHVTAAVALDWSISSGAPGAQAARRLSAIRLFGRYLRAIDQKSEVPAGRTLPRRVERKAPYIYSDEEVAALMAAARRIEEPFRALTVETLIGLLACTGLRPAEGCNLATWDIDLSEGVLTVRESKGGASRLVPLHESAVAALDRYSSVRRVVFSQQHPPRLLMWSSSQPLSVGRAAAAFRRLLQGTGITAGPGRRPPRLYDLRHRFAVTTRRWWATGRRRSRREPPTTSRSQSTWTSCST